jgi:hypothetical protein
MPSLPVDGLKAAAALDLVGFDTEDGWSLETEKG